MTDYVYRFSLRPTRSLALEVRVTAPSVVAARREVRRFLVDHDGAEWTVECVSREIAHTPFMPLALSSQDPFAAR